MPARHPETMRLAAIVPAAGRGSRMGGTLAKQYLPLAGLTMIEHSLTALLRCPAIERIVVALAADDRHFQQLALAQNPRIATVVGGAERADSVLAALDLLAAEGFDWVLVHDAARPCVQPAEIEQLIEHCLSCDQGGLLATPVRDTVKRAEAESSQVAMTVARDQLWLALTPQFFPLAGLRTASRAALAAGVAVTDEASAMEWAGHPVQLIRGSRWNIKVTDPEDLPLAAWLLGQTCKED